MTINWCKDIRVFLQQSLILTMEIHLSDTTYFRRSIEALKEFLPQAQVHVSSEGLRIRGMDTAHVGLVDYFLSAKDCEVVKAPRDSVFGVSTQFLHKVLATAQGEKLSIVEKPDSLHLTFQGEGRSAKFELPTLEIEADAVELPDMSYSATIRAKSSDFVGAVKDLSLFGDSITMALDDEGFHMRAEGDMGKGALSLEPTDDREMTLEGDSVEMSYALKYVQQILKNACLLSASLEVSFDPSLPLRVSSRFGSESYFIAFLAPKVQED